MNILPLILALVLMLTVLTVEKLEKVKNQAIIQKQYQVFLEKSERQVFNLRQDKLFGKSKKSLRQLSFRYIYDKKARDKNANTAKQYRMLIIELMKILYSDAPFYKELEQKRSNFLEELIDAVQTAADASPKKTIRRIQDISRLDLQDPELQTAFYKMLKGSITLDDLKELNEIENVKYKKDKAYISLFTYINNFGADKKAVINVQLCPPEILKAIFINDEVVEAVRAKREELAAKKENDSSSVAFKMEFFEKRRSGLDDVILNFEISSTSKVDYD